MAEPKKNIPHAKKDFRETQPDREKAEKDKRNVSNDNMVTQQQLKALESQRSAPKLKKEMKPGGGTVQTVNTEENRARERKIAEVKRKLNASSQNAKKRFNRSR